MSDKLTVTKITLKTAKGKEVELSIDEARDLHQQLDALFGPKYVPSAPIVIDRNWWPWPHYTKYPYSWSSTNVTMETGSGLQVSYQA